MRCIRSIQEAVSRRQIQAGKTSMAERYRHRLYSRRVLYVCFRHPHVDFSELINRKAGKG